MVEVEPSVTTAFARQVHGKLVGSEFDVVLSPGYFPVANLDTDIPIVIWGDATFELIHGYHPKYQSICCRTRRNWSRIEHKVQRRASLLLYTSEWAAESSRRYYGTPAHKVHVVPFGANLPWHTYASTCGKQAPDSNAIIRLLLVGSPWYAKGSDIACQAVEILRNRGRNVELDIVGSVPPKDVKLSPHIKVHGFISKTTTSGLAQLNALYGEAHLFLQPSRAECFGVVMCEAFAHGTPVIAHNTGGIGEIVKYGRNGYLYSPNEPARLADAIDLALSDGARYSSLSWRAREDYVERFHWSAAGKKAIELIRQVTKYHS